MAVQLLIRLFCPDCLRIKKEFKGFWSHFIHMDAKIITPVFNFLELLKCLWYKVCPFFIIIGLVCCSAGKELSLLNLVVGIALNFAASVCASVFLLLLSKEVKPGFCFISLVLQPVTQVQCLTELQHKNQTDFWMKSEHKESLQIRLIIWLCIFRKQSAVQATCRAFCFWLHIGITVWRRVWMLCGWTYDFN